MRVLSITHGPTVPGGVFEEEVEARGHELERWGLPLRGAPRAASGFDAVLVFGGSMHPDQDERFEWLARETEMLARLLEEDVPLLGVCLGAQLVARAAGAPVGPVSTPEVGWHEIELTPKGRDDPVLGTLPSRAHAFQWHSYTYELPEGGVELARSEVCTQAFRRGRAWGIQFHAEVTRSMVEAWVVEDADELPMPAAELLAETSSRIDTWNESGRRLCAAFLEEAAHAGQPKRRQLAD